MNSCCEKNSICSQCDPCQPKVNAYDLFVESNLLDYRYYYYPDTGSSSYYDIIYEIIIMNRSDEKIKNVQIQDSFFGGAAFLSSPLLPNVTVEVVVTSIGGNLVPKNTINISTGQILEKSSYVLPRSSARLILKITISRFSSNGLTNIALQNTILVTSTDCNNVNILPIYAKSGIVYNNNNFGSP